MAKYRVKAPDGATYEVTAPDGASQDEVLAYAKQKFSDQSSSKPERSVLRRAAVNLFGETGADTLDAAQHNVMRPLHGAAQFVEHGINSAANAILPAPQQTLSGLITGQAPHPQGMGQSLRQAINSSTQQTDQAMRGWEADYKARNPNNAATYAGATVGSVAPFLMGAGARGLAAVGERAASFLPRGAQTARAVTSGAAQGGLLAATQPVTGKDFASEKATQIGVGATLGGAIPGAAAGARAAWSAVRPALRPQAVANEQLARLLNADESILPTLREYEQFVPGEIPTTAQVLQNPRAVQAEKALANRPELKTGFVEQQNANNAARMNVLRGLAGTDEALAAANLKRRTEARAFTQDALTMGAEGQRFRQAAKAIESTRGKRMSTADFDALNQARLIANRVQRGAMEEADGVAAIRGLEVTSKTARKALDQASAAIDKNMVNPSSLMRELKNLSMSGNQTVRDAARQHIGQINEHMELNGGRVPAYALDDIRQNIGGMLAKHAPNGVVGSREAALYGPFASKIIRTLDRSVPGYRDYVSTYRANSAPINTMEAARTILTPIEQRGLNSSGDELLTLGQLNAGMNRVGRSRYGATPEAMAQLEGLRGSLKRESVSNSVKSPGSDTDYNLQSRGWLAGQLYGPTMQGPAGLARGAATLVGAGAGAHLGGPIGAAFGAGVGSGLKAGADKVNQRIAERVAAGMRDPREAAAMIEAYLKSNAKDAPALLQAYPQWRALLGYEAGASAQP